MSYPTILLTLFAATLVFIGVLLWVRTIKNGDYTVVKVAAGVGLTIVAQWAIGAGMGLDAPALARLLLWPFAVSGGAIIAWQAVEWGRRQWQRHERRLRELERGK